MISFKDTQNDPLKKLVLFVFSAESVVFYSLFANRWKCGIAWFDTELISMDICRSMSLNGSICAPGVRRGAHSFLGDRARPWGYNDGPGCMGALAP